MAQLVHWWELLIHWWDMAKIELPAPPPDAGVAQARLVAVTVSPRSRCVEAGPESLEERFPDDYVVLAVHAPESALGRRGGVVVVVVVPDVLPVAVRSSRCLSMPSSSGSSAGRQGPFSPISILYFARYALTSRQYRWQTRKGPIFYKLRRGRTPWVIG